MTDPYSTPEVLDLWESTADLLAGDAAQARKVMEHLATGFWNLPWETWYAFAKAPKRDS